MSTPIALDSLEDAIADIAAGKPVIVVDSEDRENEGDLIFAAQLAAPETVAFMIRYSSGYICVSMSDEHADKLELQPMVARNQDERKTAYTVTVDASHDITTGISAHDRSRTISLLGNPTSRCTDFIRPGHIVPLRARPWGVLERAGHTEAAVDLAKAAGLEPVGALCEIVSQIDPTKMARLPELRTFADEHDLKLITIEQLIEYRTRSEQTIERVAQANLPTEYGNFTVVAYRELVSGQEHIALVKGSLDELSGDHVLTRIHSECLTGEAFGSHKCDCGPQLHAALNAINQQGRGVVVYLRGQEGRGIGLAEKIKAYSLQDQGLDTVEANEALGLPADSRNYDAACAILRDLGVTGVELITNNPAKIEDLERHGIVVHDRQESKTVPFTESEDYLRTKQSKMGHRIDWV